MSKTIDSMFGVYEKYVNLVNARMKAQKSTTRHFKKLAGVTNMCNQWKLLDYATMSNLIEQQAHVFHQIEDGVFHINAYRALPLLPDLYVTGYRRSGEELTVGFGPRGSPFEEQATYAPKVVAIGRKSTMVYKYSRRTEIHSLGENPTVTILKTDPNMADNILSVTRHRME